MEEEINFIFWEPLPSVNLADSPSYLSSEMKEECMEEEFDTAKEIKSEENASVCSPLKMENDINPIFKELFPTINDYDDSKCADLKVERNAVENFGVMKVEKMERTVNNTPCPVSLVKRERLQDADMTVHSCSGLVKGEHSVDDHVGTECETTDHQPNTDDFGATTFARLEGGGIEWSSTEKQELACAERGRESVLETHYLKEEQQMAEDPVCVEKKDTEAQEDREHQEVEDGAHFQTRVESSFPSAELSVCRCSTERSVHQCSSEHSVCQYSTERSLHQCLAERSVCQCSVERSVHQCSAEQSVLQRSSEHSLHQCSAECSVHQCSAERSVHQCSAERSVRQYPQFSSVHLASSSSSSSEVPDKEHSEASMQTAPVPASPMERTCTGKFHPESRLDNMHRAEETDASSALYFQSSHLAGVETHSCSQEDSLETCRVAEDHCCSQCDFKSGNEEHLKMHVETAHRRAKCHCCPHCEYKSGREVTLKIHIETVHRGKWNHCCSQCDFKSGNEKHLKMHVETVHRSVKCHRCPHCEYKCGRKNTLKIHIDTVHRGKWNHCCPHCNYKSGRKGNLQVHLETVHRGERNHPCPHCEYKSGQKGNLKIHIESVHRGVKNHHCPHCEYKGASKAYLQKHIETVHRGVRNHQCPHCDYKCGHKSNLKIHIENVHSGEQNHHCPHCEYKSGQKSNLKRHVETIHRAEWNHCCPRCEYKSGRKLILKIHIETVHRGELSASSSL